jgi:hypothetical protein
LDVTNVPSNLTNITAIAAGMWHTLAISNGCAVAWGYDGSGDTDVPTGLSNVVAIAAGGFFSLALRSDGHVVAWGDNSYGQTNVPSGMSNVMAIAAGEDFGLALINDGTLVAWGDNSVGQTNTISEGTGLSVKLIAAGGFHSLAALFTPWVQYPVDVSKDLLLIYNTNSIDSSNVCQYYLTHRPMVSSANVLGVGCTTDEKIEITDFTNDIVQPVQSWLANNPTKRPSYVVLFPDMPTRVHTNGPGNPPAYETAPGVQVQINSSCAANWVPFVTSVNMNGLGGTTDCIAYIDKLAYFGSNYCPGQLILSASAGGCMNTNWYFDDTSPEFSPGFLYEGVTGVLAVDTDASIIYNAVTNSPALGTLTGHITNACNVAGFASWGCHGYYCDTNGGYATNGTIQFTGQSSWYLIETIESYNGQLSACYNSCDGLICQGNFISWYADNAFGGTNHSNTPVGAISTVEEPFLGRSGNPAIYFGLWAAEKNLAICAWNSRGSSYMQAVGDPLVRK